MTKPYESIPQLYRRANSRKEKKKKKIFCRPSCTTQAAKGKKYGAAKS